MPTPERSYPPGPAPVPAPSRAVDAGDDELIAACARHHDVGAISFRGTRLDAGTTLVVVSVGGSVVRQLPLRLDIRNHSPSGFEWGYAGSGPAQLALALCVELVGAEAGQRVYQHVKDELIAGLQDDTWSLSGDRVMKAINAAAAAWRS